MIRAYLWFDEAWPTIDVDTSGVLDELAHEIPDDLYARYLAAAREWKEVQRLLMAIKNARSGGHS